MQVGKMSEGSSKFKEEATLKFVAEFSQAMVSSLQLRMMPSLRSTPNDSIKSHGCCIVLGVTCSFVLIFISFWISGIRMKALHAEHVDLSL